MMAVATHKVNGKAHRLYDADEVRKAIPYFLPAGQVLELRALEAVTDADHRPHTATGYYNEAEALIASLAKIRTAKGIYITANPVKPALLARAKNRLKTAGRGELTSDHDIVSRRWLLIDADAQRPAGISASDAEHDAAIGRAQQIATELHYNHGWPDPLVADSGNGAHLLYRIDEPANDAGRVEKCLKALAAKFGDDSVKVDTSVHNPARIWKCYGTLACKGDNVPERPHRLARILSAPDVVGVVSRELLEALANEITPMASEKFTAANGHSTFDIDAFISRYLDVCDAEPYQGGRRWVFNQSPLCEHHGDGPFLIQFPSGALSAGCHHESCGWDWAALRAKYEPKRQGMPDLRPAECRDDVYDSKSIDPKEQRYKIISAAELDAAEYAREYHIPEILVVGDFAMLGGPEKSLKTSWLVDMFVALGVEGGHFLGTFPIARPCRTLLFSGESGMANLQDITRRVCRKAGYLLTELKNFSISPDLPLFDDNADLAALERVFEKHRPQVVGFDPMMLCLGNTDADAGNLFIIGPLLRKVYDLCQKFGATPIIAHHTRTMAVGTIPKLSDLAWSGFKQAAGQWILLNRRTEYQPGTGEHQMLMVTGGRAGHSLIRAVDVREGTSQSLGGRHWHVDVNRVDDAREAEQQRRADAKADAAQQQLDEDIRSIVQGATSLAGHQGTKTDIRTASGVRSARFDPAFAKLLQNKNFESVTLTKANGQKYAGFRLCEGAEL